MKKNNMKALVLAGACAISSLSASTMPLSDWDSANSGDTVKTRNVRKVNILKDTLIMEDVKTGERRVFKLLTPVDDFPKVEGTVEIQMTDDRDSVKVEEVKTHKKTSKIIGGITFSRIDFGFSRPLNEGSFSFGDANELLNYRPGKTTTLGFDLLQFGYRFNHRFRTFISGGLEWNYIRLENGVEFDRSRAPYEFHEPLSDDFSKNRLTSTYLRLPLTFDWKSKNGFMVAFGPVAGFLLRGTQRYKLDDGKSSIKRRGDYGFTPFQYGGFARVGYKSIGLFTRYYMNDMFENSPQDDGLQNLSFGLMIGF